MKLKVIRLLLLTTALMLLVGCGGSDVSSQCGAADECPDNFVCSGGQCLPPPAMGGCTDDTDCLSNEQCIDALCMPTTGEDDVQDTDPGTSTEDITEELDTGGEPHLSIHHDMLQILHSFLKI